MALSKQLREASNPANTAPCEITDQCAKCGYDLRGLPDMTVRCPECGISFSYAKHLAAARPHVRFDLFLRCYILACCTQIIVFLIADGIGRDHTSNIRAPAKLLRHQIGSCNALIALIAAIVGMVAILLSKLARKSKTFWTFVFLFLLVALLSLAP